VSQTAPLEEVKEFVSEPKHPTTALAVGAFLLRTGVAGTAAAAVFLLRTNLAVAPVVIGAIGSVQALAEMIFAPILGRYADEIGRRRFLVAGPLLGAVGALLVAISVTPFQVGAARIFEGVAAAAFVPTAMGVVAAATSHNRVGRSRASGFFELATLAGIAFGIFLGGYGWFHFGRAAFLLFACLYVAGAAVCFFFVPSVPPLHVSSLGVVFRAMFGPGPIRRFFPAWIMVWSIIGSFLPNVSGILVQTRHGHLDPNQVLVDRFAPFYVGLVGASWVVLLAIGVGIWILLLSWTSLRDAPRLRVMRWSLFGAMATCCSLLVANHFPLGLEVWLIPVVTLSVFAMAGFGPAALAHLADCSEAYVNDRSELMAFYTLSLAGGGALGAFLGGVAVQIDKLDGLLIFSLGLAVLAWLSLSERLPGASSRAPA
jgi:MFS family permease